MTTDIYFLKEKDSVLPDYRINNIIIEQKSMRIFCSLDKDEDTSNDSWFNSSDFLKYINFYFVVVGNLAPSQMAAVYHGKTRVQSLKYGNGDAGILNWEETFKLKSLQGVQRPRRGSGMMGRSIYGYIKVNMDEIVRGQAFKSNVSTKSKALSMDSLITGTGFSNIDPSDDTFFEVEMACDDWWLDVDQSFQGDVTRSLVSFCQLDIKKLSEDFKLSNFIGTLKEFGGPMHYEKLLELTQYEGELGPSAIERTWFVPQIVSYFEDQQGNPFKGIAHQHGTDNPGPNGYIGWMSGPDLGDMEGRILLSRREIKNTKVVSKIHTGAALGFDGNPLTDKNRFSGYPDSLSTTGDSVPSPYGSLNFGEDIMSVLRSEVGMGMLEVQTEEDASTLDTISGKKMKNLVIKKEMSDTSNFVDHATSWISTTDSKYSTIFTINKENILKQNSQYGYFLDFHREAFSSQYWSERHLLRNATFKERSSFNFVKNCVEKSRIYTMKIKRRRLTNLPTVNNSVLTADYPSYDNNEIPETLIVYSDSNDLPPGVDSDRKAVIEQVYQNGYRPVGITDIFRLDDFDLYNNVTQGRYRYSVEITLTDGVKQHLKDVYSSYYRSLKAFEDYVKEAEKPYYKNFTISDGQQGHNNGSYDYEKEQFSKFFIDRSSRYQSVIFNAVVSAMGISYILTKRSNISLVNEMIEMLSPQTADLGNLKMFLEYMQKMGHSLKKRIFKNDTNIEETLNLGTHKRRVGSGFSNPDNIITTDSDLMGSIEVASKNSVFYTIGSDDISDEQEVSDFFTLQSEIVESSRAEEELANPDVDAPSYFNSQGQTVNRNTRYIGRSLGSITDNYSEIVSAVEYSPYGESFDTRTLGQHSNPLASHNSSLFSFGGTTFNYLLNKTLSLSEVSTNECGEQVTTIPAIVEQGILDSIVSLDNREDFLEQVEEQYKGYYFTKEALGNLYNFIKHTMSNRDALTGMNVNRTQNRINKYRHLIERGTTTEQHKSQIKQLKKQKIDQSEKVLVDLYVYTSSKGWVLANTNPQDSLGIYEKRPRNNIKTKNGLKPTIVDNVYIDNETVQRTSLSDTTSGMAGITNTTVGSSIGRGFGSRTSGGFNIGY